MEDLHHLFGAHDFEQFVAKSIRHCQQHLFGSDVGGERYGGCVGIFSGTFLHHRFQHWYWHGRIGVDWASMGGERRCTGQSNCWEHPVGGYQPRHRGSHFGQHVHRAVAARIGHTG